MMSAKTDIAPGEWQVTNTTLQCGIVGDSVTIIVNGDWSSRCAWYCRYKQPSGADKKPKFDRAIQAKVSKCIGPECNIVAEYRDKLMREEPRGK